LLFEGGFFFESILQSGAAGAKLPPVMATHVPTATSPSVPAALGGIAEKPEPQLFWKGRHRPPLKINRQTRCPELDELDFFEELDDPEVLDVPEALDEPGAALDPLEPPVVGPEIPAALDDCGEFDVVGALEEPGDRNELDDPGRVIEMDDMALPLKDAG
jgi:hypothetical protein